MTPTQTQPKPKYTIGQKVTFQVTFNATGIVTSEPEWDSDEGYSYDLKEVEVSKEPTNVDFYLDKCEIDFDANSSIFSELQMWDDELRIPESLPSCEFDPN